MRVKIVYPIFVSVLLLSFILQLNINQVKAANPFHDVEKGFWAEEEISYLVEKGIVDGREVDGRESREFGPEEEVLRAQAAKMMSNALKADDIPLPPSPSFTDVDTTFWAYKHVERAAELGVFTGKKDGTFDPNGNIERAQLAAIIGRALFGEDAEHNETPVDFQDISSDFWAKGYIATLVEHDILEEEEHFRPNENATRAEVSAYLARAMKQTINIEKDVAAEEQPADEDLLFQGEVETVNDPLNVRSGPGMSFDVITALEDGTKVDVYDNIDDEWLQIDYNGEWAYVYHSYIKELDDSKATEPEQTEEEENTSSPSEDVLAIAKVTVDDLNVRTGAGTDHKKIGSLDRGDIIEIYEYASDDWALIDYDGEEGYVHRYYLQEKKPGENTLEDKTIVIDAGHGDHDSGASGHGLLEKEVVLEVALKVEEKLNDAGVDVIMTRDDDSFLSLKERVEIAEDANADAFVSIHANAALSEEAEGAETYYNDNHKEKESRALAQSIQEELLSQTEMSDRGVKDAGFYVIKYTKMPSTLVELGFVTNEDDAKRMKEEDYHDKAANAVYDGIVNYYDW